MCHSGSIETEFDSTLGVGPGSPTLSLRGSIGAPLDWKSRDSFGSLAAWLLWCTHDGWDQTEPSGHTGGRGRRGGVGGGGCQHFTWGQHLNSA